MDHSEEGNCLLAMQLVTGSVLPAALKTAIELDLLERIKQSGSVSATDLAAQLPTTNPEAHSLLDRLLCLLAAHNILNCTLRPGATERLYSLALVCNYLTRNDDGVSLAPQLLMNNFLETWYHLKDAIIEGGEPFKRAYGMSKFEYCGKNPRANKLFNDAMWNQSTLIMNNILRVYRGFEGVGSLVDVGGGVGASIKMIHSKYPSIKAINFDLPHVIQNAPSHPGVEQVSGDMFVSVPKADEDGYCNGYAMIGVMVSA